MAAIQAIAPKFIAKLKPYAHGMASKNLAGQNPVTVSTESQAARIAGA